MRFSLVAVLLALAAGASGCANNGHAIPAGGNLVSTASPLTRPDMKRRTITEFNDLPGSSSGVYFPAALTSGPDGALWVADDVDPDFGQDAIARITTAGVLTNTFYYGEYEDFTGITTGPDGALWIADNEKILRMTVDGKFTAFRPKNHGDAQSIVVGPDFALWFTQRISEDSAIGRITTQGKITMYGAPPGTQDITAGPDGALWFTDSGQSSIGRMTTHGKLTEYKDGITYGSAPHSIAPGPDGALWFTEEKSGRIGRITTKGKVTEYSRGISPHEHPIDLAAGPDQAMWFTEYRPHGSDLQGSKAKIGRITMSGKITEYSKFDSHSGPTGIVLGPDGNMWFVEYLVNSVGRVNL